MSGQSYWAIKEGIFQSAEFLIEVQIAPEFFTRWGDKSTALKFHSKRDAEWAIRSLNLRNARAVEISNAARELKMRREVYPRSVARGTMTQAQADYLTSVQECTPSDAHSRQAGGRVRGAIYGSQLR